VPHGNASARGVKMESLRIRQSNGARFDAMIFERNRVLERASLYKGELWMRPIVIGFLVASAVCGQSAPRDPGPAVGSRVPDFTAVDQNGRSRSLHSLMGPKGLMLVFFRSADW
jgi:hypothetical protein